MHPIAFRAGTLTVRWYGIAYAVALLVVLAVLRSESRRKQFELELNDLIDFILLVFPLGLIGARLYYALFYLDFFRDNPLALVGIGGGGFGLAGLAIHGGLIGGLIGLVVYSWWKGVDILEFADALAPALVLGQAIGRLGNFMNGDAYGYPTDAPWGIKFAKNTAAGTEFPGQKLHPTMLYEFGLNLLIFVTLWWLRRRGYKKGFVLSLYFILYSVGRSVISFYRAGSLWIGPIRAAHLISIVIVAGAGYFIWQGKLYRKVEKRSQESRPKGRGT